MPRITDYSFLFQNMFGMQKPTILGTFQLSQLNSSSVQKQLKAAGLLITDENAESRKRIIPIPESSRDEMFELTKKEFLRENGVQNGDTTKRSDVYTNLHWKMKKNDRLAAGYTMEKYEGAYRQAFLDAARKADPDWKVGKPVKLGALDAVTRESVETNMKKLANKATQVSVDITV